MTGHRFGPFGKGKVSTAGPSNLNSAQVPSTSISPSFDGIVPSFIDADTGFLLVYGRECDAAKINCTDTSQLLFTRDAGRSVLDVTPPEKSTGASVDGVNATAPPSVIPGFDVASAPALTQMPIAKATSSVVGIYVGGGNRYDKVQANSILVGHSSRTAWDLLSSRFGSDPRHRIRAVGIARNSHTRA
jgi:hypothetical protein